MKNSNLLLILSFILGVTAMEVAESPVGKPVACLRHAILASGTGAGCDECKEQMIQGAAEKLARWWCCVSGDEEAVI
jgi:hypothetical protein